MASSLPRALSRLDIWRFVRGYKASGSADSIFGGGAAGTANATADAAEPRLVTVRIGDGGLQIVADDEPRRSAEKGEQIDMRADPIGDLLARPRLPPVAGSTTSIVSPAKSTKTFSPAAWLCRMLGRSRLLNAP